jgi:hypothetical protein
MSGRDGPLYQICIECANTLFLVEKCLEAMSGKIWLGTTSHPFFNFISMKNFEILNSKTASGAAANRC